MARGSRSVSKLQDQLKNARARARRLRAPDPIQHLAMGAVGGAVIALMNNNNLKLPIPGVPASLQVGATALVIQKTLKPSGMLGKALQSTIGASGAVFGYGLANKYGFGGSSDNQLLGADEFATLGEGAGAQFNYLGRDTSDHLQEG
jgi:hypothetical protein